MNQGAKYLILSVMILVWATQLRAQTKVLGVVTDAATGDPIPYAQVGIPNSGIGTVTDFNGRYQLELSQPADSLVAIVVGYVRKAKPLEGGSEITLHFQLEEELLEIVEVTGDKYENPAWAILRGVIENKDIHNKNQLEAYQFESYVRLEASIDNITDKFRKRKAVREVIDVIDTIAALSGEDGKPVIPVFLSESISDYYFIKNPKRSKEIIHKNKVDGIGITDGSTVSQLVGSTFQEYNFYNNIMTIANKDFISPLSDSWRLFYDYELKNNPIEPYMADGHPVWEISFTPKRPQDLAFSGTMWVTDSTYGYALKRIEVTVGKEANLNFVEKLKIQQELTPVNHVWMPNKSRILVDIGEINDQWAGLLLKNYVSNRNFELDQPKPLKFYDQEIEVAETVNMDNTESYWQAHRHDSLSPESLRKYEAISEIKDIPTVRTYVDIAELLINGYQPAGKYLELGTYTHLYANNNIEGHRFRMGMRTTPDFSKRFVFQGYLAYGTLDQLFKYKASFKYLLDRTKWTVFGVSTSFDLERVGIFNADEPLSPLFAASVRFGEQLAPFHSTIHTFWTGTQITRSIRQKLTLRNRRFEPLDQFYFAYYDPERVNDQVRKRNFQVTEAVLETRIAIRETFIQNGNDRISLGTRGRPIITLRYTYGFDGLLDSDFAFHKLYASVEQYVRMGGVGRFYYKIDGGWIPSRVPYPLLETHLGNESYFYNVNSFNMMNFFEFVSDRYTSLSVIHRFDGFLLNRIPLMRKLKWRSLATAKALYGTTSQENLDLIPDFDLAGNQIIKPDKLGNLPFVEVSYGIENIFKFLRIEALHRITYRNRTGIQRFAVKVSAQFRL